MNEKMFKYSGSKIKRIFTNIKNSFTKKLLLYLLIGVLLILGMVVTEFLMGRLIICKCGYVSLWYNNANGPGNSQHIFDWYTFSHIIHGMVFYGLLWLIARRLPPQTRFILALVIESAWEILENSPFIIDRYRTATFAIDYYGDSIINSVSDVLAMCFGFILARKFRIWIIIILIIAMELFVGYMIHDNLSLNIINLIHPTETIKNWQAAAPNLSELWSN